MLAWRADGRLLATGGEDGLLVLWAPADGWPVSNNANAHQQKRPPNYYGKLPGGVLGVAFSAKGEVLSVGRDKAVKRWSSEGRELKALPTGELPLHCAFSADGSSFVVGGAKGGVTVQPVAQPGS